MNLWNESPDAVALAERRWEDEVSFETKIDGVVVMVLSLRSTGRAPVTSIKSRGNCMGVRKSGSVQLKRPLKTYIGGQ